MKRSASPEPAVMVLFFRAAYSRVRTVVVPTATTRRFCSRARLICPAASSAIVGLPMDGVLFHHFLPHRLECSQTNVQGDLSDLDTALANVSKNLGGEVQAGGGCGYAAHRTGIDCLVALPVFDPVLPADVWRQG